jgi:hypothetical protein
MSYPLSYASGRRALVQVATKFDVSVENSVHGSGIFFHCVKATQKKKRATNTIIFCTNTMSHPVSHLTDEKQCQFSPKNVPVRSTEISILTLNYVATCTRPSFL